MNNSLVISRLKVLFNGVQAQRAVFRTVAKSDVFPLFLATEHEDFNRFLLWPAPVTHKEITPQIEKLIKESDLNRIVALSLCDRDTGAWNGLVRLTPFRDGLELGMWLHPGVWNKGLIVTSGKAVIQLVLDKAPETPIYNRIMVGNEKARRLTLSYGFEKIEELEEIHNNGHKIPLEIFKLNPEKWHQYNKLEFY